tara:strand:+ start:67 stop:258 length:192 start_codon:yes stop_codon:yes gene_type:complete
MFYIRKEKEYGGIKFYLTTLGSNSWWISHDYRNAKKIMKHFRKYSEAVKFYNDLEKTYKVVTV